MISYTEKRGLKEGRMFGQGERASIWPGIL